MVKALVILIVAGLVFGTSGYFAYELFVRPQIALKREKDAPATPAPPDSALPDFEKCVAIKRSGKLLEARAAFYNFIDQNPASSKLEDARNELGEINTRIFLTPIPSPEKSVYVVKGGDVITRVAQKNKSTPELLMRANGLNGSMLRIGQKLLLPPADFSLVISRKKGRVIVSNNGKFFKQYPIVSLPPELELKKGAPPQPKQTGKVIEKISWLDGTRVTYNDKGYLSATHWIVINIRHCTFYSAQPPNADPKKTTKPTSGIVLPLQATNELGAMLVRGNPVTLE